MPARLILLYLILHQTGGNALKKKINTGGFLHKT